MDNKSGFRYSKAIGILNIITGVLFLFLGLNFYSLAVSAYILESSIAPIIVLFTVITFVWALVLLSTGILSIIRKFSKLVLVSSILTLPVILVIAVLAHLEIGMYISFFLIIIAWVFIFEIFAIGFMRKSSALQAIPTTKIERKFMWLPVLASAAIGVTVIFSLYFLIKLVMGYLPFGAAIGILAFSCFVAGLIAGIWTIRRGPTHGVSAALLVGIVAVIISLVIGVWRAFSIAEIIFGSILFYLIPGMILGALGGFVGRLIRH